MIDEIRNNFAYAINQSNNLQTVITKLPQQYPAWTIKLDHEYGVEIEVDPNIEISETFANCSIKSKEINSKYYLILTSDAEELHYEFATLCAEFVEPGPNGANRASILKDPLAWWVHWKDLLGNVSRDARPYSIIAEMSALYDLFQLDKTARWTARGSRSTHDIEGLKGNHEIKSTIKRHSSKVTISTEFQLQAHCPLYLDFYRMEESIHGVSINDMEEKLIQIGYDRNSLKKQLSSLLVDEQSTFRKKRYIIHEKKTYLVDDKFPKIVAASFHNNKYPDHISNISYDINLDALTSIDEKLKFINMNSCTSFENYQDFFEKVIKTAEAVCEDDVYKKGCSTPIYFVDEPTMDAENEQEAFESFVDDELLAYDLEFTEKNGGEKAREKIQSYRQKTEELTRIGLWKDDVRLSMDGNEMGEALQERWNQICQKELDLAEELKQIQNEVSILLEEARESNPERKQKVRELEKSFDHKKKMEYLSKIDCLGLYFRKSKQTDPKVWICLDKIVRLYPNNADIIAVQTIIHELGHAVMDIRICEGSNALTKWVEEPLANKIALKYMAAASSVCSNGLNETVAFVRSQPDEYQFGEHLFSIEQNEPNAFDCQKWGAARALMFGKADDLKAWKNYISNFCNTNNKPDVQRLKDLFKNLVD